MSRKSEVRPEQKVDIVLRCLKGECGIREAGGSIGVSNATIRRWISRYEAEGAEAFVAHKPNGEYSAELKQQAVEDYLCGKGSLLEISKKYKLRNTRQLSNWLKVYNAHGDFNSVKQSGGGSYMKQGQASTQEEPIQITKDCIASGRNYGKMALKYQVSYQQVRTWTLRFEQQGASGLEDQAGQAEEGSGTAHGAGTDTD